ncbi:MAG: RagB/SusD family nutrient uptake outer membrane protein [Longimicrobiales bacterium]
MKISKNRAVAMGTGLVALAAAAYGCGDFLTTPPQGQLNELTLADANGVEAALIATYRAIERVNQGWGAAASNWALGSVPSDDAYKGSEASDQPAINPIELYQWGAGEGQSYINDRWRAVYDGVSRANSTLRLLDRVLTEKPGELTEEAANGIRGEALFLRAHFHFEGWKMWANIPYYVESDTDFRKPNASSDEVVSSTLADLDQAISLLPETPRIIGQVGRATQWTAKAYKGRVQVYSGDYAGGLGTLRDVVDNGPYGLEPSFDYVWTGFADRANGPETVFAFQASANDGDPDGNNANYGERLNFPHSGSPFGCCGFHQPSQNLVNFFHVDDAGLPLALSQGNLSPLDATASWNADDANFTGGSTPAVDPRLDWTAGRDNVPYKDWGMHAPGWIRSASYGGPYSSKKNVHEQASGAESTVGWTPTQLNSVNIHLYRYADVLLLLAEAEVEAGSIEAARQIVNQIRARAGSAVQGCGLPASADAVASLVAMYPQCEGDARIAVPIDDPSIGWASYRVGLYPSFPNQEYARAAVRYERRLELAMEGHRLFDLQRWGIAVDVLNRYVEVESTRRSYLRGAAQVTDRHLLYPIPPVQIDLSRTADGASPLTQNPGW